MHWERVSLVGVGLLGGSLGLALRQRHLAERVVGYVRRAQSVQECREAGAVHEATLDIRAAVADADLVVFCTPVAQMQPLASTIAKFLKKGAVVTDVGSVKRAVVSALEPEIAKAGAHFVGSHPMAGSENTGVSASRADLFEKAVCVITSTRRTDPAARKQVKSLWEAVGCRIMEMTPARHDLLVSRSSHLPQALAANLAALVLNPAHSPEQQLLCANGFRDCTRIASGSPEMWRDIAVANRDYISRALRGYKRGLDEFLVKLEAGDPEQILRFFEVAKRRRDNWVKTTSTKQP